MNRRRPNQKILRILSLALVFVMVFSTLGTGGWQVLADDLETQEEPAAAEIVELEAEIEEEPAAEETEEPAAEETEEPAAEEEVLPEETEEEVVLEEEAAVPEEPVVEETITEPVEEESADSLIADAIQTVNEPVVITYPAQDFRDATDDISVRVHAPEGVFPAGTQMRLTPVHPDVLIRAAKESGEANVSCAVAVDIVFVYEGEEVQPKGDVQVTLVSRKVLQGESHQAVTMDGDGNVEQVGEASAVRAAFDTDHFTVYGIIGGNYADEDVEEYIRHTYEFYVGDYEEPTANTVKVDEIIVHHGDMLTVPADPAGDAKHTFAGWYMADEEGNLTDNKVESGTVTIDPATKSAAEEAGGTAEDRTIKVYAKFDTQYTVTLYADAEQNRIFDTIIDIDEKTVEIPLPEVAVSRGLIVPAGNKMTGWKYAGVDGETVKGNSVTIDGADIELVPVFASSHNVKFELIKKDIFDPIPDQNVLDGDKVEKPTQYVEGETYKGYQFDGWYTEYDPEKESIDEAFSNQFNFDKALEEGDGDSEGNIVLYAKWIPSFELTVKVYLENANDDGYTYKESKKFSYEDGLDALVTNILDYYKKDNYTGFHLNKMGAKPTQSQYADNRYAIEFLDAEGAVIAEYDAKVGSWIRGKEDIEIAEDGSSVVRVNYSRDTYLLQFRFDPTLCTPTNVDATGTVDGMKGGTKLTNVYKDLAPGKEQFITGQSTYIRYGESLYTRAYLPNERVQKFMDCGDGWYFWAYWRETPGQTVFNEFNKYLHFYPKSGAQDGGELLCMIYYDGDNKDFPITNIYYADDSMSSDAEIAELSKTFTISYNNNHAHEFTINEVVDGYRLAAVTNYNGGNTRDDGIRMYYTTADFRERTEYRKRVSGGEEGSEEDGKTKVTYRYYFKRGDGTDPTNGDLDPQPLYCHWVPATYKITFKQTEKPGIVNGETVSAATVENDVDIEAPYGSDLSKILAEKVPNWNELKDDRGVVYSRTGDWLGDDVAEGGGFPNTMPAHDMVFYLEWTPENYRVIFDLNDGTDNAIKEGPDNLAWGVRVPDPANYGYDKREGWTLLGWEAYELDRDDDGNPEQGTRIGEGYFTFNTPVKHDLYLKAVWAKPGGYQVVYQSGDHGKIGGDTEKEDPQTYDSNSKAPVKYTATPEEGWVFTGWAIGGIVDEDTTLYGSGDVITYSAENDAAGETDDEKKSDSIITLVAQYAKIDRMTKVTYHSNYPAGGPDQKVDIENAVINGDHLVALPTATAIGFSDLYTAPDGNRYQFLGWTTDAKNEKVYADIASARQALDVFGAGETAAAGVEDNHLYAIWQVIVDETPPTPPTPPTPSRPNPEPDPDPDIPDEEIPEDEVPLGGGEDTPDDPDITEEDSEASGEDYEAGYEEEEELNDEDIPLTPFTGDDRHTAAWGFLSLLSLAGILFLGRKHRELE